MHVHVVGAGGHARSVIALLKASGISPMAVFDDSFVEGIEEQILGLPFMGKIASLPCEIPVVLAIGNNHKRKAYFELLELYSKVVIHPTAWADPTARVGVSTLLFAHSFLNAEAKVGKNCIINSGAIIEHESYVGDHCHISVNASVCGRVRIGDECFIGAGAVVKDGVSICAGTTIGAGAVVLRNITESGVYVGVPAKKIH